MKKLIILSLVILLHLGSSAQITINKSDMPLLNDTVRYSTSVSSVTTLLNQSGANQSWDFSFLVPNGQEIASFKSASSINIAYLLSFSTSSYGSQSNDLTLGIIQATDVYNFYNNGNTSFAVDGRGFSISGSPLPLTQTYTGKDILYRFPMDYNDKDSNTYVSSEANALIAQLVSSGKRVNTVDGWGSITTPYGTFSCLRVKSVVRVTDTIKTQFINLPITRNFTEYKWLAKGQKIPILEITVNSGLGGQTTIKYRDSYRASVFANKARFVANRTKTLPGDTINLNDQSLDNPTAWQWTINPSTFQYVSGTNANTQSPRVVFTDTGHYTIKLKATYSAGVDDSTRTNYIQVGNAPVPNFSADKTVSTTSLAVNFSDNSTGSPATWLWTFSPNTVSFIGGTNASSQNPKVIFNDTGYYNVSLRCANAFGNKTSVKNNYIHILTQLGNPPVAAFNVDNVAPTTSTVVNFSDASTNTPDTWLWTFNPNTVSFVASSNISQNPKVVFNNSGTYTVTLKASNAFGFDEELKSNYIVVLNTSVGNEPEEDGLQAYPNPTSSDLHIQLSVGESSVKICNLLGETFYQRTGIPGGSLHLSINTWVKGIYILQTERSGKVYTRKLILQ